MIRYELEDLQNLKNKERGIYLLCDKENIPLYVGMSANLRGRLDYKQLSQVYIPKGVAHAFIIFEDQILSDIPMRLYYVETIIVDFLRPILNKKIFPHRAKNYKELNLNF